MSKPPASRTRHNLGESFLFLLDDVRQKVIEEGLTGNTQTPSSVLQLQYSDFVAWLYGGSAKQGRPDAGLEDRSTAEAIGHALKNGATDTAHEIAALSDLRSWCAGNTVSHPETPEIEPEGLEL